MKRKSALTVRISTLLMVTLWILPAVAGAHDVVSGDSKKPPKVMVVIYSLEIDTTFLGVAAAGNRSVENQIENRLIQSGFEVIDAAQFDKKKELRACLSKNDFLSANRLLLDFGADIFIYGDVRRSFVGERFILGRPTRFFSNEIRLKAVSADTSRVLFSGYETKPPSGEGATLPIEDAASALCDKLIPAIELNEAEASSAPGRYELHISGIAFDLVPAFLQSLKKIEGVENAGMEIFEQGKAVIRLNYDGPPMNLAEALAQLEDMPLDITRIQSNSISAQLKNHLRH